MASELSELVSRTKQDLPDLHACSGSATEKVLKPEGQQRSQAASILKGKVSIAWFLSTKILLICRGIAWHRKQSSAEYMRPT